MPDHIIRNLEALRALYPPVMERARLKTLPRLDAHCIQFIAHAPLLCLGTMGAGGGDVTPRGDAPGFVHVLDESTLAIPDWPGNNRLDSLENIVERPEVGLLFLVPGVDESLRVNGRARISVDPVLIGQWNVNGKHPRSVLLVTVDEAYMHCGKALIRSRLWHDTYKVQREQLPTYGQMLKDQIQIADSAEEIQQSVTDAYKNRLY